ncbi:MAG: 2-C-methyl-D-erythritol 4-phosphate cytidylyltransferase [Myxococcales bacterium]|nr:2-C-methyl-D-erythritol 4-phosphate cytidylyltransferase [Myxococcales bacterium]
MTVAALVVAAGRGERLGRELPKAYVELVGQTLLERSLAAMDRALEIDIVQPVIGADDVERFAGLGLGPSPKRLDPVIGGAVRQDSVAAGLAALPESVEWVAVHDAARCLIALEDISRVIAEAKKHGAALLAVPARDTIKRVRDGAVVETPDRHECWSAQTPQVFRYDVLREALDKARADGFAGTDDAQLVERLGIPVRVVSGSIRNIKITLPEDLALAESWLKAESWLAAESGLAGEESR